MPRLIILLLILAALAILAVQNLSTSISLVILGSARTPEIPFGLLLLGAVCIGALVTLILYGLVGLQRSPESKYRPIGRRVPYPDTSGSSLPTSSPSYSPAEAATPSVASYGAASSSTAFVNEPAPPPPQDSFNVGQPSFTPEPIRENPEKKKSRFGRQSDPLESRKAGDDWGEINTTKQRDSWDTESELNREPGIAGVKQSLFDFMGIKQSADGSLGQVNAGDRNIDDPDDDLDSGWENVEGYDSSRPLPSENSNSSSDRRLYRDGLYGDGVSSQNRYEDERYEYEGYEREGYEDEGYEDDSVYEADYRVIVPPSQSLDQPPSQPLDQPPSQPQDRREEDYS
ncbi:MAG: hypothetical protein WBA76_18520 [Phormidesmis sp.]